MKIGTRSFAGSPPVATIVIPRDPEPIVFKAQAVLDWADAERHLGQQPLPMMTVKPGQEPVPDFKNPEYLRKVNEYNLRLQHWIVLETLKATPNLTWERVKEDDPSTWELYRVELKEAGLVPAEVSYIINEVYRVNALDNKMMIEARNSFLAGQGKSIT